MNLNEEMELERRANELIDASYYEGSECGEWWQIISNAVLDIKNRNEPSEELINALIKEFNETYENFIEECEWVEEEVVTKQKTKVLRFKYE